MRRLLTLATAAALLLGAAPAFAQSPDDLKQKLEAKLQEPWTKSPEWITDYDKAREEAEKTGKVIFAYFTRSYAF